MKTRIMLSSTSDLVSVTQSIKLSYSVEYQYSNRRFPAMQYDVMASKFLDFSQQMLLNFCQLPFLCISKCIYKFPSTPRWTTR